MNACMHARAAQNHPYIKFTETTDLCARVGMLNEDCPHAEVWVTSRNASLTTNGGIAGAVQAAVAMPTFEIANDFVFTNGKQHRYELAPATATQPARTVPLLTIGIIGGRMEFAFEDPICWYVDSAFESTYWQTGHSSTLADEAGSSAGTSTLLSSEPRRLLDLPSQNKVRKF